MSKSKLKKRYIFIDSRIRNKKRQYFLVVINYNTGFGYDKVEYFHYPCFKKTFPTKREARQYAFQMIDKLEARYKNLRFVAYALHE